MTVPEAEILIVSESRYETKDDTDLVIRLTTKEFGFDWQGC